MSKTGFGLQQKAETFEKACDAGDALSCSSLGLLYNHGDGVAQDRTRAVALLLKACRLGMPKACGWLKGLKR